MKFRDGIQASKFKLYNSDHAIVVGSSVAGLLTARVLAEHFTHVTVIERDSLLNEVGPRAGVPQSHHIHALLPRGLQIVEKFFPGFVRSCKAQAQFPWILATMSRGLRHKDGG